MPIIFHLPQDVEMKLRRDHPNLDLEAKNVVALDLFRREMITIFQLRTILGMTRSEMDNYLIERGEYAQSPTLEDLEADYTGIAQTRAAVR